MMARITGVRTDLCHKMYQPSWNSWRSCPQKIDHPGPCGDPPPSEQDEHLRRMIRASNRLETFIDALRDLPEVERVEAIGELLDEYCQHCGRESDEEWVGRCQCTNEE